MKARYGVIKTITILVLVFSAVFTKISAGQVTMGILPVNVPSESSAGLDTRQLQAISSQMHDYLAAQLSGTGNITKLSREHILLLLKEMSSHTPENLDIEAYKTISRKEKLDYLLKCSVESLSLSGKMVNAPVRIIIIDGSNGKMFWEKTIKTVKTINETPVSELILMDQVFKPSLDEMIKEILTLKY